MKRRLIVRVGIAAAICVAAVLNLRAQPVQIHPDPTTATPGGPIVIAVLADHFTSGEETIFKQAAANLFTYGLLADPYYAGKASSFTVKTIFQPWSASAATPNSNYGFEIGAGASNCSITWAPNTTALVDAAAGVINPARVVVIGNYGYVFGCTNDSWTYVTGGSVGQSVLQHEFGHLLAGLYDEYASAAHVADTYPPPPLDCRNCSTNTNSPRWGPLGFPGVTNPPACDLYGLGIVHPTASCRMGATGNTFCPVCKRELDNAIDHYGDPDWDDIGCGPINPNLTNPSAPSAPKGLRVSLAGFDLLRLQQPVPPLPPRPVVPAPGVTQPAATQQDRPIVRVVISLNRLTNAITVQRATNATGRFIPSHRRLSAYVYEVSESGRSISVGVLPGDPFQARDYRGGSQNHGVVQTETANIVVPIPDETIEGLRAAGRAVQIQFYRLSPQVTASRITPAALGELRNNKLAEPVATLSPDVLRTALQ